MAPCRALLALVVRTCILLRTCEQSLMRGIATHAVICITAAQAKLTRALLTQGRRLNFCHLLLLLSMGNRHSYLKALHAQPLQPLDPPLLMFSSSWLSGRSEGSTSSGGVQLHMRRHSGTMLSAIFVCPAACDSPAVNTIDGINDAAPECPDQACSQADC